MSAKKGRNFASEKAFQNSANGMRQKMKRKIAKVKTTGANVAQIFLRPESSFKECGSETLGSVTDSSVRGRDGLVEGFIHRGQRKGQGGASL